VNLRLSATCPGGSYHGAENNKLFVGPRRNGREENRESPRKDPKMPTSMSMQSNKRIASAARLLVIAVISVSVSYDAFGEPDDKTARKRESYYKDMAANGIFLYHALYELAEEEGRTKKMKGIVRGHSSISVSYYVKAKRGEIEFYPDVDAGITKMFPLVNDEHEDDFADPLNWGDGYAIGNRVTVHVHGDNPISSVEEYVDFVNGFVAYFDFDVEPIKVEDIPVP